MKNNSLLFLCLLIGGHLFLLSQLVFFPYPELFVYSYLTKAGLLPYKQIFDQHFPGLMFLPVNFATIGIDTVAEYRIVQLMLVFINHIMIFKISGKFFKSKLHILMPNIFYLIFQPFYEGTVLWIDSFIPVILLASYYFYIVWFETKSAPKIFLSGLSLGIACVFKQVAIPLAGLIGLYVLITSRSIKILSLYILGVGIPLIFLLVYLFRLGVWNEFFYWTFTFNITVFAEMGRKYPTYLDLIKITPIFSFILLFLQSKKPSIETQITILILYFGGSLAFIYARFDLVHFQPALIFGVLLVAITLRSLNRVQKLGLVSLYVLFVLNFIAPFYKTNWGSTVYFFGESESKITQEIQKLTTKEDKIFAFGTLPHIYFLADRLPAGNQFVFQFPWFMKVAESQIFDGLLVDPPVVIIRDTQSTTADWNLISFMPRVASFVDQNYTTIDTINGVELMIKK